MLVEDLKAEDGKSRIKALEKIAARIQSLAGDDRGTSHSYRIDSPRALRAAIVSAFFPTAAGRDAA